MRKRILSGHHHCSGSCGTHSRLLGGDTKTRDSRGLLTPVALLCLVLLVFSGAAIAQFSAARWRSTLRVDADTEVANILASATNIVDGLTGRFGPQEASTRIGTGWHSLPGGQGCAVEVLQGCWTAAFAEDSREVIVPGRALPYELPVWTVTVAAAARCDHSRMPTSVADARKICEAVASDVVLTYEPTAPLPVYPTLLHSGRFWPDVPDTPPISACADGATPPSHGAAVWCAIPELSRPPADAYSDPNPANWVTVQADHIVASGLFVNTDGSGLVFDRDANAACGEGRCEAVNPSDHRTLAHGTEDLALHERACTANPTVWDWAARGHNEATQARADWESRWDSELVDFVAALAGTWSVSDVRAEWANTVTEASLDWVTDADIHAVIVPVPGTADKERAAAEALAELAGGIVPRDPDIGILLEADETTELTVSGVPAGGMVVAKGSIRITGNVPADADTPVIIVAGCHIIMDGPCVVDDVTNAVVVSSPCDPSAVTNPDHDPATIRRDNLALTNVVLLAAGGVWAADLTTPVAADPCETPGDTSPLTTASPGPGLPTLSVTGSVVTGHAGATSRFRDIDCLGGGLLESKVSFGYIRESYLPDGERWSTASVSWWPNRSSGVWRRR